MTYKAIKDAFLSTLLTLLMVWSVNPKFLKNRNNASFDFSDYCELTGFDARPSRLASPVIQATRSTKMAASSTFVSTNLSETG